MPPFGNTYYEMFLATVNLVGNLNPDDQSTMYTKIIENELEIRKALITPETDHHTP